MTADPRDDPLYQQWLRTQQSDPLEQPVLEPDPVLEPVPAPEPQPAYASGPVAHQAVAGADSDQPVPLDGTAVYPAPVDHLARAHAVGTHPGLSAGASN